ncbi:hypothetical protein GRS96_03270 [Rathayibacter sp. VKM Ac-2803]|uniref:hypothetical protein n=1 Tax=unclassified Rathayibacter TaxID=2609250 RepID=UPI0013588982|nr:MULTISPECIES: hypothetical protein [unclassified Rathayibacter]MWV48295.1 hypothetical protein [Rathayibacter sp. VKM Ac-2803]MWV59212.1 hypothetical protein [Rathayibacter sp. VKM Ac-2754]
MSTETLPETTAVTAIAPPRPRIRAGAIVWGAVVAAFSVFLLLVASDTALRADVVDRALALGGGGATALTIAVLGGIALLVGLVRVLDRR